jgi:hypothetical protein
MPSPIVSLRRLLRRLDTDIGFGITPRRVAVVMLLGMVVVNIGNALAVARQPSLAEADPSDGRGWLLLVRENNPSTWFTSVSLLAAAVAVMLVAATHSKGSYERRRWLQLAVVPAVLSLDEVASVHERLGRLFDGSGLLFYSWVLPAAVLIAATVAFFARFLWRQGPYVRWLMVVSGALTAGGGVGVEAFNGLLDERGQKGLIYHAMTAVEENFEMLGVAVVTVGLVHLAGRRGLRVTAQVVETEDLVTEDLVTEDLVTEDLVTEDLVTEERSLEIVTPSPPARSLSE